MPDGSQQFSAERVVAMPVQHRLAPISKVDKEARTFELTWAAGAQVRRYDWYNDEIFLEELEMTREACDLTRLNNGAPLLNTHQRWDLDSVLGVVERAWIEDGLGGAAVRMSARDEVKPIAQDVADKIVRNVSVGYDIYEMREMPRDPKTGYRVMRVTKWAPTEISLVPIGADRQAQTREADKDAPKTECKVLPLDVERSKESEPAKAPEAAAAVRDAATPEPAQAAPKGNSMTTEVTPAAATPAEPKAPAITAAAAERERQEAIMNLCRSMNVDARAQAQWIEQGTPLTKVMGELADLQKLRSDVKPVLASEVGLTKRETQQYSIVRAIRALQYGGRDPHLIREAAFEIDCSNAVAKQVQRACEGSILVPAEVLQRQIGTEAARDMATTPGSKGGYAVDVKNMGFIDILRNRSVSMNMGIRVLSGLQGNVSFTRQTGKPSVTWQAGEHTAVTPADQALGQLSMSPKTCIVITKVSEQLLRQSSPAAEGFIMADLASDIAIDGVDYAVINGTGGAQPLGIKNTTGVATAQDASSATYAKILAFPSTAGTANALRGNRGFVTNTAGAAVLMQKQRFTSTDTPLWEGTLEDGTLVGYRAMSSEQLASGNLIFGSWDEVILGEWGVLELATDNGGTNFTTASVSIRAMWMVDVVVRYPQAFVVSVNLSA